MVNPVHILRDCQYISKGSHLCDYHKQGFMAGNFVHMNGHINIRMNDSKKRFYGTLAKDMFIIKIGQHMVKKSMPERYELLQWLHNKKQQYQTEGREIDLRMVKKLLETFRDNEREYTKQDIIAYMAKVSGEPDFPHSLKTALPEFLELLEDD